MAENIQWRESLEAARREAQENGKLVLIELFSPKCGGCMTMEKETFPDAQVESAIHDNFVPVHYNVLDEPQHLQEFTASWTPTLIVQDAQGREQRRSQGYLDAPRFLGEMALARVQAAMNRQDYGAAHQLAEEAVRQTEGDTLRRPEALYWSAVAAYKASDDQSRLVEGWTQLLETHPDSEWAKRAEFIRRM